MINIYSVKMAVKNGDIQFIKTDKGILCEDVHSGERVCVHTFDGEKKENRQYVIRIDCCCVPMFFMGLVQKQTSGQGKVFVSNSVSSAWQTTDITTLESMIEEINNALQERPDLNMGLGNVKIGVIDFGSKR